MALDTADTPPPRSEPHPALCLAAGFGVIILGAMLVHLVFNALF